MFLEKKVSLSWKYFWTSHHVMPDWGILLWAKTLSENCLKHFYSIEDICTFAVYINLRGEMFVMKIKWNENVTFLTFIEPRGWLKFIPRPTFCYITLDPAYVCYRKIFLRSVQSNWRKNQGDLDILISWYLDILISWYLDILISWYLDILISWYLDILISWYLDILMS